MPADPICCAPTARGETLEGWHLVTEHRRSPSSQAFRLPAFNARPAPPSWLKDRCFRCLSKGHHAHSCRDPIRCRSCLYFGHTARFCHAKNNSHQSTPLRRTAPSPSQVPAPAKDATMVEVPLQSVLAEQAELQDCLMRVESFLARAEAVLCRLTIMPDLPPLAEIQVDSKGEGETDPYGCFSPRNRHIAEVVTPVMQIMPGLQELCEAPSPPLSMVLTKEMSLVMPMMPSLPMLAASPPFIVVDNERHDSPLSCEHLEMPESIVSVVPVAADVEMVSMLAHDPLEPNQSLAFVDSGGSDVAFTHSHVIVW